MAPLDAARVDALWQFRYRHRRRPHGLRRLVVDPLDAILSVDAGDGIAETVHAEARWRDPVAYGVTASGQVDLDKRSGSEGLVEWPVDLGAAPVGARLVAVLAGFEIDLGATPCDSIAELSVFVGLPSGDGHATAGVSISSRRGDPEVSASMSLLVLAVPADRLEVHTPSSSSVRRGGFESHQRPLAATIGSQRLRPLGIAAFGIHLTAGRPEHASARRLRELGVSVNGLVMRWQVSTAATFARAATARATATVPCVRLD
ncbi:MAG: hypothetical protein U0U69_03270 [Acidimicrobiia bacterium]